MNTQILVAGGVILSLGVIRAVGHNTGLSKPVLGATVFVLLLSLLEAFGNAQLNRVLGAIALLAMFTVATFELPAILSMVQGHTGA